MKRILCEDSFQLVIFIGTFYGTDIINPYPVKVVEGGTKFIHLFLADSFGISGQYLVFYFINGSSDCCEELLPAHSDVLQDQKEDSPIILS